MPLVQGGPPEWIWERLPDVAKWTLVPFHDSAGQTGYELRVDCGLQIMRLQFFSADELRELQSLIGETLGDRIAQPGGRKGTR